MPYSTPADTIVTLVEARNRGDIELALSCYEADASVIAEPGKLMSGLESIRAVLQNFVSLQPAFSVTHCEIIERQDIALHYSRWTFRAAMPAGDPLELTGKSTDVLRRQGDGRWLIVIDNPWGTDLLG